MTTMVAMVGMVKVAGIGRRVYDEVKRHKVMTTSEVSVVEGMERWRGEWRNGGVREWRLGAEEGMMGRCGMTEKSKQGKVMFKQRE